MYEPLDDPVLSSFSKCLATDILCVWRRVASQGQDQHRHNLQDGNQLNCKKELWVFWYGEEPDLTGLVNPELTPDPEQGSWESGLSYDCRTLLFKSLHNLIERCLLSSGYARIGRWFFRPLDSDKTMESSQLSFSFNFFIHGESTVCASVDVRQRTLVCQLSRHHLSLAQGSHNGLKVLLGPYGMAGTLTGQSYKETDMGTQKILNDWNHFFPVKSRKVKDSVPEDDHITSMVEVIVGGAKMRYPSCYVLVTEIDESAAISQSSGITHFSSFSNSSSSFCSSQQKASLHTSVLTPPTSPCDPSLAANCNFNRNHLGPFSETLSESAIRAFMGYSAALKIKEASWQDSSLQGRKQVVEGSEQCYWDFSDPSSLVRCNCSRCKALNQEKSSIKTVPSSVNTVVTTASPSAPVGSPSCTTASGTTGPVRKVEKN